MKIRKISYILVVAFLFCLFTGCDKPSKQEETESIPADYDGLMKYWKQQADTDTVTCWYTSDTDKVWLEGWRKRF